MGRQEGVIKLSGQVGGLTFYKTGDGFMARLKGGINPDRIKHDPAFERTRENGAEFGKAGQAGKLVRTALRPLILNSADKRMAGRLTRDMLKVIQADGIHTRGNRQVLGVNVIKLEGFEFNENGKLGSTWYAPYTVVIDRASGTMTIQVPEFIPQHVITPPQGATHARLIAAGIEPDFLNKQYVMNSSQSNLFILGSQTVPQLILSQQVTPASTQPLLLALGIEFYQEVNGQWYPLKNGAYNALALVKVDG